MCGKSRSIGMCFRSADHLSYKICTVRYYKKGLIASSDELPLVICTALGNQGVFLATAIVSTI